MVPIVPVLIGIAAASFVFLSVAAIFVMFYVVRLIRETLNQVSPVLGMQKAQYELLSSQESQQLKQSEILQLIYRAAQEQCAIANLQMKQAEATAKSVARLSEILAAPGDPTQGIGNYLAPMEGGGGGFGVNEAINLRRAGLSEEFISGRVGR